MPIFLFTKIQGKSNLLKEFSEVCHLPFADSLFLSILSLLVQQVRQVLCLFRPYNPLQSPGFL